MPMSKLDEQITLCHEELQLHPEGHHNRANSLYEDPRLLCDLFSQRGEITNIDGALALGHSVLELRPQGHPDRACSLGNLASSLHSHFNQLGRLSDLEEALSLEHSALELCLQRHPDRLIYRATSRVPFTAISTSSEGYVTSSRHLPKSLADLECADNGGHLFESG